MKQVAKRIASLLPTSWQQTLKRTYYGWQITRGHFAEGEPDYQILQELVTEGDWVLDVGANVGGYTFRFSALVGESGRVIAFEPVPETFALLAANVARFRHKNVTLVNTAASDAPKTAFMSVPKFDTGMDNYYMAQIGPAITDTQVLCLAIDSLHLPHRIGLAKIDAEGHDLSVLKGMRQVISRDRPTLIIEDSSEETSSFLSELGYRFEPVRGSVNRVCHPVEAAK